MLPMLCMSVRTTPMQDRYEYRSFLQRARSIGRPATLVHPPPQSFALQQRDRGTFILEDKRKRPATQVPGPIRQRRLGISMGFWQNSMRVAISYGQPIMEALRKMGFMGLRWTLPKIFLPLATPRVLPA